MQPPAGPRTFLMLVGLGSFFSGVSLVRRAPSAVSLAGVAPTVGWIAIVMGCACIGVAAFSRRLRA